MNISPFPCHFYNLLHNVSWVSVWILKFIVGFLFAKSWNFNSLVSYGFLILLGTCSIQICSRMSCSLQGGLCFLSLHTSRTWSKNTTNCFPYCLYTYTWSSQLFCLFRRLLTSAPLVRMARPGWNRWTCPWMLHHPNGQVNCLTLGKSSSSSSSFITRLSATWRWSVWSPFTWCEVTSLHANETSGRNITLHQAKQQI